MKVADSEIVQGHEHPAPIIELKGVTKVYGIGEAEVRACRA